MLVLQWARVDGEQAMNINAARNYLNACSTLLDPKSKSLHANAREVMQYYAKELPPAWVAATRTALGL